MSFPLLPLRVSESLSKLTSRPLSGIPRVKCHHRARRSQAASSQSLRCTLMYGACSQVAVCMQGQKVLLEKTGSQLGEQELPHFQLQTPRRYPKESSQEEVSQARSQDQLSPHHWEKSPLFQEPTPKLAVTGKYSVPPQSLLSVLYLHQKHPMVLKSCRPDVGFS